MVTYSISGKDFARQVVEHTFEFHPDMTAQQREESIPMCLDAMTVYTGLTLVFIGMMTWLIS